MVHMEGTLDPHVGEGGAEEATSVLVEDLREPA